MSGEVLLDTNIVIALLDNDSAVLQALSEVRNVLIPSIVIGELYFGAHKSTRVQDNAARIDDLVSASAILPCDAETGRHYGEIKSTLRQKGHPLPENDLWIAALARQHALTLVSRDQHFAHVDDITVIRW